MMQNSIRKEEIIRLAKQYREAFGGSKTWC